MTKKKYVLTCVAFTLMLILALILFFVGLFNREQNEVVFYIFLICACVCVLLAIIFITINYKKLTAYDICRIKSKVDRLDFLTIDESVLESELYDRLIKNGYELKDDIFTKLVEDNCGDGNIVNRYYSFIYKENKAIDIPSVLEKLQKGFTTYNFGYIFLSDNVEESLSIIKKYIKETILDVKVHAYKYKKFFAPLIIANNKIYYIDESGIFMNTYRFAVKEGINILKNR